MADSTSTTASSETDAAPQPGSAATAAATASTSAARKKSKGSVFSKQALAKTVYRLPSNLDKAIRYVALMQEDMPGVANSANEILAEAVTRHLDYLRKKGFDFPEQILPA